MDRFSSGYGKYLPEGLRRLSLCYDVFFMRTEDLVNGSESSLGESNDSFPTQQITAKKPRILVIGCSMGVCAESLEKALRSLLLSNIPLAIYSVAEPLLIIDATLLIGSGIDIPLLSQEGLESIFEAVRGTRRGQCIRLLESPFSSTAPKLHGPSSDEAKNIVSESGVKTELVREFTQLSTKFIVLDEDTSTNYEFALLGGRELSQVERVYLVNAAIEALNLGSFVLAVERAELALLHGEPIPAALLVRGVAKASLGNIQQAKADLSEFLKFEPHHAQVAEILSSL